MSYDFTTMMETLIRQIVPATPELTHIDPNRVLVSMTQQRSRWREGLYAKLVPLRFQNGTRTCQHNGRTFETVPIIHNGIEQLYVISFCMPRFLNRTLKEKIETVFHELYHIGPRFDGDLRRYGASGRVHTQAFYRAVDRLATRYQETSGTQQTEFLAPNYRSIRRKHGSVQGRAVRISQPRLVTHYKVHQQQFSFEQDPARNAAS